MASSPSQENLNTSHVVLNSKADPPLSLLCVALPKHDRRLSCACLQTAPQCQIPQWSVPPTFHGTDRRTSQFGSLQARWVRARCAFSQEIAHGTASSGIRSSCFDQCSFLHGPSRTLVNNDALNGRHRVPPDALLSGLQGSRLCRVPHCRGEPTRSNPFLSPLSIFFFFFLCPSYHLDLHGPSPVIPFLCQARPDHARSVMVRSGRVKLGGLRAVCFTP